MIVLSPSLKPGQAAPDFCLNDAAGRQLCLGDFKGKWLVLFFYPADFTPGCTAESCAFRDQYQAFKELGAEIAGVSGDAQPTHLAFSGQFKLPYPLLSDPHGVMRRSYTVPHVFGRLSGRTTFVIDPQGLIRYVFDSRSRPLDHVTLALEQLSHAH
jgi:peroxiredoxin Q/BCP